ncbi:MAG: hypothetical protein ACHQE6_05815 [Solirubrobacterales bacterium]
MAARTIVTSHPDVACDVCGRRLLRGEQPDVFLGGGQRRLVCELCTPRATHEGWRREAEAHTAQPRSDRPQRGRSLLGRLRQSRWSAPGGAGDPPIADRPATPAVRAEGTGAGQRPTDTSGTPVEAEWSAIGAEWANVEEEWTETEERLGGESAVEEASGAVGSARAGLADLLDGDVRADPSAQRALEVFNAGEYPRRVAGVARSLGAPSVRVAQAAGATVAIVVAWELCWYRYEVDLGDEARGAWLAAEGMELEELLAEDRVANAVADERGELGLLVG